MSTASSTAQPTAAGALTFVAWAVTVAGVLIADVGPLWIALPSALAAVVAYRTNPAKLWLAYAAVAIALVLAFIWTSALFTYSSPATTTIIG